MSEATETTTPAEFPKMLYRGGQAYGETGHGVPHQDTIVVNDHDEEAAAREDGFSEAAVTLEAEAGDETITGSEPPAGSAIDSDPAHVLVHSGEPGADELPPLGDSPNEGLADDPSLVTADANGDGHDDATGQFVEGNQEAAGSAPAGEPGADA